jgi:hypothetical protein
MTKSPLPSGENLWGHAETPHVLERHRRAARVNENRGATFGLRNKERKDMGVLRRAAGINRIKPTQNTYTFTNRTATVRSTTLFWHPAFDELVPSFADSSFPRRAGKPSEFRVQGLGFRFYGLGLGGLGFRV